MMNKSILLVDDHAVVRQGLQSLLKQCKYEILAEASSGESAIILWQKHQPDLILMDLDMPGIGGLEAMQRILARNKDVKILIYSMHENSIYAMRAIQSGAKGYVVKTDNINVLLKAVEKVMKGGRFIEERLAQHLAVDLISLSNNPLEKLTSREFEVFRQLALSNSLTSISSNLNISYKTVANIQTQIRQKLNLQTSTHLIQLAIKLGVTTTKFSQ